MDISLSSEIRMYNVNISFLIKLSYVYIIHICIAYLTILAELLYKLEAIIHFTK